MPNGFDNPYQTGLEAQMGWGTVPFETSIGTFGTKFFMGPEMINAFDILPGYDAPYQAFYNQFPELFQDYLGQYLGESFNFPEMEGAIQYQGISPEIMHALDNIFTSPAEELTSQSTWGMTDFYESVGIDPDYGWDFQGLTESGWEPENYTPFPWESYYDDEFFHSGLLDAISDEQWAQWEIPGFGSQAMQIAAALPYLDASIPSFMHNNPSYLWGTDIFDPESIAHALSEIGIPDGDPITGAEIRALTPEMIQKTEKGYYEPYETVGRKKLTKQLGEDIGKVSSGGFAGSGGYSGDIALARKGYDKGYQNIFEDIVGMQAGATEDVLDTIYGWQEMLSEQ